MRQPDPARKRVGQGRGADCGLNTSALILGRARGKSVLLCRARHPLSWALCAVGGASLPMLPNRYVLKRLLHVSDLEYVLASSNKCHQGPSFCGQGRLSVRKQMKGRAGAVPLGRGPPAGSPGDEQRQSCQPRPRRGGTGAARDTQDRWAW